MTENKELLFALNPSSLLGRVQAFKDFMWPSYTTLGFPLLPFQNTQSLRGSPSNHRDSQYSRYPPIHTKSKYIFNL